jgi:diguanylate cyclase (GGDEF)-like protein
LTDANRQYEGLEQNERCRLYAGALNKALEILVSYTEKDMDIVLSRGLWPIATAAGLDRIIVFRILDKGPMTFGEKYRWDRVTGGTAPLDDILKELPLTTALAHWVSVMSNDSCISLKRCDFNEDEAAFLSPRGVMSILIIPVFTEKKLWGVVTCHDNTKERDFDEDCIAMLRSAARICAGTIIRAEKSRAANQAVEALRRREMMTEVLNRVSLIFLSEKEDKFEDTMGIGVRLIANITDIDKMSLFCNNVRDNNLFTSQVYRWDRTAGGSTGLVESFNDIPYAQLIPSWQEHLEKGHSINSPSRLLPPGSEAAILQSFGIFSVCVIPIHINNSFWGFAIFADTKNEHYFDDDVVEMMRSAAFLLANAFIRTEVEYDALTGIYNRRFFDKTMAHLFGFLSRSESLLSMLMIDIDFFKLYNDTYGHIEGDKCLKAVAKILSHSITRRDDFIVRYGGEEFIVVLPNTDERGAHLIADKLLKNVRNLNIPHEHSCAAKYITISIGCITGNVLHTQKLDDFVNNADKLMYKSKHDGRDRASFGRM